MESKREDWRNKEFNFFAKAIDNGAGVYRVTIPKEVTDATGIKNGTILEVKFKFADFVRGKGYGKTKRN